MASPDLIIFDCDGVLIDSEGLAHQALIDVLASYDIHLTMEEALKRYAGVSSASETADIRLRYQDKISSDYVERKNARRTELFEQSLKAISGIFELIDALPKKKCVASSSSPERLSQTLGLVGLWDRFAPHIFSSTQVKNGKPAPDLFLFAAEQMGVPPSSCLVIEDSIPGVRAAQAAKMRVFGFTGGSHCGSDHADKLRREGAEQVFSAMSQIAEALQIFPSEI